jgi:hypothetical protein
MLKIQNLQYFSFLSKYENLKKKVVNLRSKLSELEDKIQLLQMQTLKEILEAVDEEGNPLYTNESSRKTAFILKLQENQEYMRLKNQYDKLKKRKELLEVSCDVLDKTIKLLIAEAGQEAR